MTSPDPTDSRAVEALTELLRSSTKPPSSSELQRGLVALRTRLATAPSYRRARLRWSLVVVVAVCCVVVSVLSVSSMRESSSALPAVALNRIEGGQLLDGGYLSESGHSGMRLSFNEGSEFSLMPGARGRLRELNERGAHFAVEHGGASFRITKDPRRRWSVEAGPFLVLVKGTDFSVTWDPASESFELKLRRGSVTVSGPVVGDDFALRAGQKLAVSLPKAETLITEDREDRALPSTPVASAAAVSPTPESDRSDTSAPTPRPRAPASSATAVQGSAPERRWREALASGQWDRILADVEREGLDATLQAAPSDDLFALADAARYRRRVDLARAALLAQRQRFPSSPRTLYATFLLGRVEELRESGGASAIRWYDEYLNRAPSGTYAAEALGRKMILTNQMAGPTAARRIADEYLRRFPTGSHAGAARALRRVP